MFFLFFLKYLTCKKLFDYLLIKHKKEKKKREFIHFIKLLKNV